MKRLIAKLKHDKFGASSERGRKLIDQLELQLDELVTAASEAAAAAEKAVPKDPTADRPASPARRPVRAALPAHLPRERVVVPAPSACPCCGGRLRKLGEDWPAAGLVDREIRFSNPIGGPHAATDIQPGVQA